jgi:hypothetical protein
MLITLAALIAGGCYVSPVPMSDNKLPIDERLLGSWINQEDDNRYVVRRADDRNYSITWSGYDEETEQWEEKVLPAFLTRLNGNTFINVWIEAEEGEEAEEEGYIFLRYAIQEGAEREIQFWVMAEELFQDDEGEVITFDSSRKLRSYTRKHLRDSKLWMEDALVLRPYTGQSEAKVTAGE